MEVLWLTPDKPATISVGRTRIAEHLERAGHEVALRGTTPRTAWRSLRERGRYDVVVGTTRSGAIAGVPISRAHGVPLVVDHIDPIRQFAESHPTWLVTSVRLAENAAFRAAAHVLYVYDEEESRVRRYAGTATQTALGVAFDRFANPSDAVLARARRDLSARGIDGPVLLYVGGLEPIYHVDVLLEAIAYLDGWTLVVLGTGSMEARVRETAAERADVVALGTVPHESVPGYLHAADVGACLVDDPHTLKALEYGAAGLPTVHLAGRAEKRLGEFVTFARADPADVTRAVRIAAASEDDAIEAYRSFVRTFDYARVAETYARTIERAVGANHEAITNIE